MNFFQVEPLLYITVFALVFYLHGAFFSKNMVLNESWPEKFFINCTLGFAFVLFCLFFISLVSLLYVPVVVITFCIIPLFHIFNTIKFSTPRLNVKNVYSGFVSHAILVCIIIYFVLPDAYRLFLPDRGSDSVRYHLPYAKFYVENHGLAVNEFLRYPVHTQNFNMAFVLGFLFQGNIQGELLARLFGVFSFILTLTGLYCLVMKSINKVTALIAVLLLANNDVLKLQMINGYVDIGLGLIIFTCIYFLYLWQKNNEKHLLYVSAAMLGIALGTKYLALLLVLPLSIWVLITNKSWKQMLVYFTIAIVIGSPWYIRNIILAGNPIHPFAQDLFGYWLWTPEDIVSQKEDLLTRYGIERTFYNFIRFPWLMINESFPIKSAIGNFVAIGVPLLFISIKMSRFFKFLAVFLGLNIVFWFYTSQIARYLIFAMPFIVIFTAYPMGFILSKFSTFIPKNKYFTVLSQVVVLSLVIFAWIDMTKYYKKTDAWLPLPETVADWENYLVKQNDHYVFTKYLNEKDVNRFYNVSDASLQNVFNGQVLGDWFGIANKRLIFVQCKEESCIKSVMKKFNTKYLLVDKTKKWFNNVNIILSKGKSFKKVMATDKSNLYKLEFND